MTDDGAGSTSNNVYVLDKEFGWMPARLVSQTEEKAVVSIPTYADEGSILSDGGKGATSWREETVQLKHYPGKALPLQNVKDGSLIQVEDMVDLPFLHEAAILFNLKDRHVNALPYTRTGDIVIAVNPYQWLTHLYTEEVQLKYAKQLVWTASETDPRKNVAPHVYETSALSYKGLAVDSTSQSILVSGESGAGKTETVKICMNHIASVQRGTVDDNAPKEVNKVVQRVVNSNPLLEAFGNAKTRRNDNSSRFGKYIQLQFDHEGTPPVGQLIPTCKLAGSKCEVYLLEKSRVVDHDEKERTYHIFYAIINASDKDKEAIWSGLVGKGNKDFKYIGYTDHQEWDGKPDTEHYALTRESLKFIDMQDDKLITLMRAITVVLQLGNITFGEFEGDADKSAVQSKPEFEALCELIGIPGNELEAAFTERVMVTRGETFKVPLKPDGAKDSCDAFAKEIYAKVFLWLVREINAATCAEDNYDGARKSDFSTIGLLDIFGFESFPVNGFEQLCINYANEKLQQKFTKDIFQTVQEEYKFEGIALDDIKYDDNTDVLDLIESRTGLLAMLNEECVRPKGSDKEFVYKAIKQNSKSPCLIHGRLLGPLDFGIHHYAGKVVYFAQGFLQRNQDTISADLVKVSQKATNDIIANHLQNEKMTKGDTAPAGPAVNRTTMRRGKSNIVADTLWTKFRTQLNSLMKNLNETQSRYIRCVKPNTVKKPLIMQHITTIEQLRCAGVVAAVTISRSAFPNRLDHRACLERFKVLHTTKGKKAKREEGEQLDYKDEVSNMLTLAFGEFKSEKTPFVVGKTRVYFRAGALEFLENERMRSWDQWVLDIQRVTRGWLVRKSNAARIMAKMSPKAIPIQSAWRGYLARKVLKRLKKDKKQKKKAEKRKHKAAAKIQATVRTYLWRPKFQALLKEKREREGLRHQIKELEKAVQEAEARRLKEVEEARAAAEAEMEAYREKIKDEMQNDVGMQKKSAQQQSLIEESGKIIEYLRKENMKLRTQNETMRKDFKALKDNNHRLMEANASAGKSFNALNEHAKKLNGTNAKLIKSVEIYKQQLEKLKEDLKVRQAYYLAEAEARLTYQKTMAQIVGAIQDKCRDAQLTEDVVIMALECEAEAKSERAALEAANKKPSSGLHSQAAAPAARSAPPPVKKPETSKADEEDSDDSDDSDEDSDED